jgi:hypothetical protein
MGVSHFDNGHGIHGSPIQPPIGLLRVRFQAWAENEPIRSIEIRGNVARKVTDELVIAAGHAS